ncbi:MAG: type II toxin-antitoxin system HicA family toxin [Planctomycetes bacterium]|nr:type II toxin-antitoxin system HicA family toxin [Planctomycetota bacterium]
MGRLRILSGREVCKIIAREGFLKVRQRVSHIVMQRRSGNSTITVPVPDYKEIRHGTLQSIIRQSGLPRHLFEFE